MGSISPSANWGISCNGSVGFVEVAGIMGYNITLVDVDNQGTYQGYLAGSAVGAGASLGGSASTFSPTFFTVSPPMYATDFDNKLCTMIDIGLTVIVGGSMTGLSIHGVNHSPSILDLGGMTSGFSAGFTVSPLLYLYVPNVAPDPVPGPTIAPDGDPQGTDSSGTGQNSCVDPGVAPDPDSSSTSTDQSTSQ